LPAKLAVTDKPALFGQMEVIQIGIFELRVLQATIFAFVDLLTLLFEHFTHF
jgi:hypothetical protein